MRRFVQAQNDASGQPTHIQIRNSTSDAQIDELYQRILHKSTRISDALAGKTRRFVQSRHSVAKATQI